MNVSDVMNALHSPVTNPQRSGKDLSHRKVFSLKVGELLPVLCEEVMPKDYFEIDVASLTRSLQPLNTAAFLRAKLHFDFFFVPMTSIWRNFDNFYYQRDDNYTSYKQGSAYEPNVTLKALADYATYFVGAGAGFNRSSPQARQKILQLLGYGHIYSDATDFDNGGDYANIAYNTVTALPLYAYNRIYNLHYRDPWRDVPNAADIATSSADNIPCDTFPHSLIGRTTGFGIPNAGNSTAVPNLLSMHYHRYPEDLFMGLLPSQQFGSVSTIDIALPSTSFTTSDDVNRWKLANGNTALTSSADINVTDNSSVSSLAQVVSGSFNSIKHDHTFSVSSMSSSFDVITLRRAIAAQKWKEYNARAGWKAGKQAKAMFGVDHPIDRQHDIEWIDGYQFPIMVDEVVAQSTNDSSASNPNGTLGELGGKVIGVGNGHTIKFSTGERWGYIMCIAYVQPQVDYNARGISKMLVRSTPEQHYMPAYQNLGLEAVHRFELTADGSTSTFDTVIGYAPRYHEYKTRVDQIFMDFMSGGSLDAWCVARRDLENASISGQIPLNLLYVNPIVMDTVFAAAADNSTATDHFMVNANFRLKATRPMSDLGLPVM